MLQYRTWFLTFLTLVLQPPPKHWEAVAFNEPTGEFAVFSGAEFNNGKFYTTDSLWIFDERWEFFDDNSITGRWAHAMAWHQNELFTYGGMMINNHGKEVLLSDLNVHHKTWKKVSEGPLLVRPFLFSSGGKLSLAGQTSENHCVFEIWEYASGQFKKTASVDIGLDPDGFDLLQVDNQIVLTYYSANGFTIRSLNNNQVQFIKNQPRLEKIAITYVSILRSYFIFGGIKHDQNFSADLYQIKDGYSKKINVSGPCARAGAHLVTCSKDLILYGGTNEKGIPNAEMWRFENDLWRKVAYP